MKEWIYEEIRRQRITRAAGVRDEGLEALERREVKREDSELFQKMNESYMNSPEAIKKVKEGKLIERKVDDLIKESLGYGNQQAVANLQAIVEYPLSCLVLGGNWASVGFPFLPCSELNNFEGVNRFWSEDLDGLYFPRVMLQSIAS